MKGKKLLLAVLAVGLSFCFSGITNAQRSWSIRPKKNSFNGLIQARGSEQLYHLFDGKKYPIPMEDENYSAAIMDSWGWEDEEVKQLPARLVDRFPTMENVTIRPGTYLLYLDCAIYAVEYNNRLRRFNAIEPLPVIYGDNWMGRVVTLPESNRADYVVTNAGYDIVMFGNMVTGLPKGSIMKFGQSESSIWGKLIGSSQSRIITTDGIVANKFQSKFFINNFDHYQTGWGWTKTATSFPIVSHDPALDYVSRWMNIDEVHQIIVGLPSSYNTEFVWLKSITLGGLPRGFLVGDTLEITYNDGSLLLTAEGVIENDLYDSTKINCLVDWGQIVPCPERQHFTLKKVK